MEGEKAADYDFYSKELEVKDNYLGSFKLATGKHILRLECMGRNVMSKGNQLGLDSIRLRERRDKNRKLLSLKSKVEGALRAAAGFAEGDAITQLEPIWKTTRPHRSPRPVRSLVSPMPGQWRSSFHRAIADEIFSSFRRYTKTLLSFLGLYWLDSSHPTTPLRQVDLLPGCPANLGFEPLVVVAISVGIHAILIRIHLE